jgi:lysophospholipase L1-like esterase
MAGYKDHPQYSFVFGTAKDDGIFSLRERFEALGAKPTMYDASKTGKKMSDAVRQASIVVAAAKKLPAGATVYVVFELGTNDLCGQPETPMTKPATFDAQARAAIKVLTDGLPADSGILMLSVPDFVHFRNITQADPTARAHFKVDNNINRCPPFLGANSAISLTAATRILSQYNDSLMAACADAQAGGRIHCASDRGGLAEADFKIGDLSKADYFHPSFTGQAKMAEAAWIHGYWNGLQLPPDAAARDSGPARGGLVAAIEHVALAPQMGRSRS